jgi:hypothetical protein
MSSQLSCIDPDLLAGVTGGKTTSDEQLTTALTTIQSNLKDLSAAKNNNSNNLNQLVPLMFMAKIARREI